MALREIVTWIILSHVVFETYCKTIVDVFHSHKIDKSGFWCLVKDCKTLFSLNANLFFHFIKKQANRVSYIVARAACYNASPLYWLEVPPFIM